MKKLLLASILLTTVSVNAQTKKVMLEDFTGDWCQYCPNGTQGIIDMEGTYPTTFLPVATHCGGNPVDPLQIPDGLAIKNAMYVTGVPNGAIDRLQFPGQPKVPIGIVTGAAAWKTAVANRLTAPALVSVSFANTKYRADSGIYEADINVKFTSAPTAGVPLDLQVYILENKIPAEVANNLAQTNTTTNWGGANPLTSSQHGYYHDHTLRQALGGTWGWSNVIPTNPKVDSVYTKHISFTIPGTAVPAGWVKDNVDLYAFVSYHAPMTGTSGTSALGNEREILNAEKMRLKDGFFPVGIEETAVGTKILSTYPNPAKVNDIISTVYNLKESTEVTLKVYNSAGQLVATPMNNSHEVAGAHTFQWRASEQGISSGVYFTELSTSNTKYVQKVIIQ